MTEAALFERLRLFSAENIYVFSCHNPLVKSHEAGRGAGQSGSGNLSDVTV